MSDLTDQPKPATRPVVLLLFAIAVVASAGLIDNLATIPNIPVWYAGLNKPGFTPPNWVFGPVWSLLYAMMVLAFWRVLLRRSRWTTAGWRVVGVFLVQMALNAFWSVAFFGMHNPLLGLVVVIALELMIVAILFSASSPARWPKESLYFLK